MHSAETKAKMSIAHKGIVFSPTHLTNIKLAALKRPPRQSTPILCGHTDRPHYGLGKCNACYQRYKRAKKKGTITMAVLPDEPYAPPVLPDGPIPVKGPTQPAPPIPAPERNS